MPIFKSKSSKKSEVPPLIHPPLLEAIFEIRWEIEHNPENGRTNDPSYPMLYGSLYERLKKDFSITEDLPSAQAHPDATPYIPRHRMRKEKNGYPLIQIGPGILTVNDSKGYRWSSFRPLILRVVESLFDLYPKNGSPLNLSKSELRYVNGVGFDIGRENPLSFLAEKLHMKVELSPQFFELNSLDDKPNALGLNLSYPLDKPMGNLAIGASLGQFEGRPAFIQQILIQSFGDMTPSDVKGFVQWLQEAHTAAENSFLALFKGNLMEKFGGA